MVIGSAKKVVNTIILNLNVPNSFSPRISSSQIPKQFSNNNQAEVRRRGSAREASSATPVREVHRSPSLNIERSTFVMQIKVEIVVE